VINVALGGTLVQDVSLAPEWEEHPTDRGWHRWKEVEHASLHGREDVPHHPRHAMRIEPGSRLHDALGVDEIDVNSFHHQAIDRLGRGLRVSARATGDSVVEAVEMDHGSFVVAVQWHPESFWREADSFHALFAAHVEACRAPAPVRAR
jgi:putative glutamine amidotransferase